MKKWFVLVLFVLFGPPAHAQFLEEVEYKRIPPQPVETGARIEVREFFWYGCPHCYTLEPFLEKWQKTLPKNAQFVRTPAVFNERWAVHARAYYAFEVLGITGKLHNALFRALHVDKQPLYDPQSLADFVGKHGGNAKTFLDAYNSFGVQASVNRAVQVGQGADIRSVPTLVVDGRYVTDANIAGGYDRVPLVLDFLIKKAAAERAGKK